MTSEFSLTTPLYTNKEQPQLPSPSTLASASYYMYSQPALLSRGCSAKLSVVSVHPLSRRLHCVSCRAPFCLVSTRAHSPRRVENITVVPAHRAHVRAAADQQQAGQRATGSAVCVAMRESVYFGVGLPRVSALASLDTWTCAGERLLLGSLASRAAPRSALSTTVSVSVPGFGFFILMDCILILLHALYYMYRAELEMSARTIWLQSWLIDGQGDLENEHQSAITDDARAQGSSRGEWWSSSGESAVAAAPHAVPRALPA